MEIIYEILYDKRVRSKDFPKLPIEWRKKIEFAIEQKLTSHPDVFGKPLQQSLRHYRRLRVGDYRVIFRIEGNKVMIFIIGHRSSVYLEVQSRLRRN